MTRLEYLETKLCIANAIDAEYQQGCGVYAVKLLMNKMSHRVKEESTFKASLHNAYDHTRHYSSLVMYARQI